MKNELHTFITPDIRQSNYLQVTQFVAKKLNIELYEFKHIRELLAEIESISTKAYGMIITYCTEYEKWSKLTGSGTVKSEDAAKNVNEAIQKRDNAAKQIQEWLKS